MSNIILISQRFYKKFDYSKYFSQKVSPKSKKA